MSATLSLSYGKDSLACLGALEVLGWPIDRIVHAEVWATDTIPADPPPMVEFKAKADAIIKARWGIEVEHLCAMKNGEKMTFEKHFYHIPQRKSKKCGGGRYRQWPGQIEGWPSIWKPWCNGALKRTAMQQARNLRVAHHPGELVYQRPQTPSFPAAPLHKGLGQILCSILASPPMNQSELSGTSTAQA